MYVNDELDLIKMRLEALCRSALDEYVSSENYSVNALAGSALMLKRFFDFKHGNSEFTCLELKNQANELLEIYKMRDIPIKF